MESMLISLIDFINNIIKRHTYDRILLLIDEGISFTSRRY